MAEPAAESIPSAPSKKSKNQRPSYKHPNPPPEVLLPSHTDPVATQRVIGVVSTLHKSIEQFRGIPYGAVPDRWQPAILNRALPYDVFDATEHGPKCEQGGGGNNTALYQSHLDFPNVRESEFKCLNLFITRPSPSALSDIGVDSSAHRLPVYFYIHGGGFGFGAGTDPIWDPTWMVLRSLELRKPLIVVMINYRLNLFGFAASSLLLDSQADTFPKGCNFGIRDQRVALEWTRLNIAAFGGDPENIVLGGQSAGGCAVHSHVLDAKLNASVLPFKRAIIQSGAFACFGIAPTTVEACDSKWNQLSKYFELQNWKDQDQLEELRIIAGGRMVKACEDLGWIVFSLVEDNITIRAIPDAKWHLDFNIGYDQPEPTNKPNEVKPLQILIGDTASEGSAFIAGALPKLQTFESILAIFSPSFTTPAHALEVLSAYSITPSTSLPALHDGLNEFMSHSAFGYGIRLAHRELASHSSPSSLHPSRSQLYKVKFGNPFDGPFHGNAHHCVDLIYQFDAFHDALIAQDQREVDAGYQGVSNVELRQTVQDYWIGFIVGDVEIEDEEAGLVFEEDRTVTRERMEESPYWVDQNRKLDVIAKYRKETAEVQNRLLALARGVN